MGGKRRTHNKDYFDVAGRSPGPAGPLKQFKDQLAQGRAVLRRDEEHKLPGEHPIAGKKPAGGEEQAGRHARPSVLDSLPSPVGAAGVPDSMKAVPTRQPGDEEAERGEMPTADEPRAGSPAWGYGIPASEDTALGHDREPFAREEEARRSEERQQLGGVAQRVVRTFPWAFGVIGEAARVIDRPIKRTLDRLQWLGREARRT